MCYFNLALLKFIDEVSTSILSKKNVRFSLSIMYLQSDGLFLSFSNIVPFILFLQLS